MSKQELNMLALEQQMAEVEIDAFDDEKKNATDNFASLDNELSLIINSIPYPETKPYTTCIDYEDHSRIKFEKNQNYPFWKKQEEVELYCNADKLYDGHVRIGNTDFFFTEDIRLATKLLKVNGTDVWLVSVDDKKYAKYLRCWRFPNEDTQVEFSRNITMLKREILDVDVILDKKSAVFANITDSYLRKALIRNKGKTGVQSIIQTIQKKQDSIRSLPKDKSFVVQGCAGSGKTMVLLHRLRYLIYNKEIESNEYVFLVPGDGFKNFIDSASSSFNINRNNIIPYQEYYKKLLGRKNNKNDIETSELVFSYAFLSRVYSKGFLQDCYRELFRMLSEQTNRLIDICDNKLNEITNIEKNSINAEIDAIKKDTFETSKALIDNVEPSLSTKLRDYYDIPKLLKELLSVYYKNEREYKPSEEKVPEIIISPDDERVLNDIHLAQLRQEILDEEIAVRKASIFTVRSHKKKLEQIKKRYEILYNKTISILLEEDRKKYAARPADSEKLLEGVSLLYIEILIISISRLIKSSEERIKSLKTNLTKIEEIVVVKYSKEIEALNSLIDLSGVMDSEAEEIITSLTSCCKFFDRCINTGSALYQSFCMVSNATKENMGTDDNFKKNLKFFAQRSENQLQSYLYTLLFNICKKKLKEEHNVKICDVYKHYWYLALYCNYLTRDMSIKRSSYICVDEAQDLSVSELELIYKLNSDNNTQHRPVINLFGDLNQAITEHGISDWSHFDYISEKFILEENFRNTNQIVDYCNKHLPIRMTKIGVDMEEVSEYETITDALKKSNTIYQDAIFIVKDEYSKADLEEILKRIMVVDFQIYTVKQVKGLEFKEVFVCNTDMTFNEKYIAYTRALAKLNVVRYLPHIIDRSVSLAIQGEDINDKNEDELIT